MKWTVEHRNREGRVDPFNQPEFLFRRRAVRYARKHSCEHGTYTVKSVDNCPDGHRRDGS